MLPVPGNRVKHFWEINTWYSRYFEYSEYFGL